MQNFFQGSLNYFFFAGVGFLFFIGVLYFIFFWRKKNNFIHYSPRFQIKKIVIIALFAATSTSVVFILTKFTSLTVIPSVRIAFEGVLVKISGFLFGPFVGMVCAIATEFGVLLFIPSYFHYKYFLVLIAFGFFSGMIKVLIKGKVSIRGQIIAIFFGLVFFFGLTQFFFYLNLSENNNLKFHSWNETVRLFKLKYLSNLNFMSLVFFGNLFAFFVLFAGVFFITFLINNRRKRPSFISLKTLRNVLPILVLAFFAEYFVSVFISTSANQFGESSQSGFILLTMALLIAPFKIAINTFIIYQVWNAFNKHISRRLTL